MNEVNLFAIQYNTSQKAREACRMSKGKQYHSIPNQAKRKCQVLEAQWADDRTKGAERTHSAIVRERLFGQGQCGWRPCKYWRCSSAGPAWKLVCCFQPGAVTTGKPYQCPQTQPRNVPHVRFGASNEHCGISESRIGECIRSKQKPGMIVGK